MPSGAPGAGVLRPGQRGPSPAGSLLLVLLAFISSGEAPRTLSSTDHLTPTTILASASGCWGVRSVEGSFAPGTGKEFS